MTAPFDAALDRLLPTFAEGIDLAFIDGDKSPGSFVALFRRLETRLNRCAILIFDDIQWSAVTRDWHFMCAREGISFATSAGRFGVCVWEGGETRPMARSLFGIGRWDLCALRRDLIGARLRSDV